MADKCTPESKETPMSEAREHKTSFLKEAVRDSEKMPKRSGSKRMKSGRGGGRK